MAIKNAYQAGQELLCGGYSSYTPTGASYFKKAGRWRTVPERGYIVYFYNSSLKRIGHVAIVTSVDKAARTFETIEGNTSAKEFTTNGGCSARHSYSYAAVGGTNRVQGFGIPRYGADTCSADDLIAAAERWLDYEEKKSTGTDAQLQDKHWNPGKNNITWFGRWYGIEDGQWCQMFVSYIAYEACRDAREQKETGWRQQPDGTWKYLEAGEPVRDEWREIGGRWYVFNGAGTMIVGWFKGADGWYYMNPEDGAMLAGQWIQLPDAWYYLTKSGLMAAYTYVRSAAEKSLYYWVGSDGKWEEQWTTAHPDLGKYGLAE